MIPLVIQTPCKYLVADYYLPPHLYSSSLRDSSIFQVQRFELLHEEILILRSPSSLQSDLLGRPLLKQWFPSFSLNVAIQEYLPETALNNHFYAAPPSTFRTGIGSLSTCMVLEWYRVLDRQWIERVAFVLPCGRSPGRVEQNPCGPYRLPGPKERFRFHPGSGTQHRPLWLRWAIDHTQTVTKPLSGASSGKDRSFKGIVDLVIDPPTIVVSRLFSDQLCISSPYSQCWKISSISIFGHAGSKG